jgi:hypothetical protein
MFIVHFPRACCLEMVDDMVIHNHLHARPILTMITSGDITIQPTVSHFEGTYICCVRNAEFCHTKR